MSGYGFPPPPGGPPHGGPPPGYGPPRGQRPPFYNNGPPPGIITKFITNRNKPDQCVDCQIIPSYFCYHRSLIDYYEKRNLPQRTLQENPDKVQDFICV